MKGPEFPLPTDCGANITGGEGGSNKIVKEGHEGTFLLSLGDTPSGKQVSVVLTDLGKNGIGARFPGNSELTIKPGHSIDLSGGLESRDTRIIATDIIGVTLDGKKI